MLQLNFFLKSLHTEINQPYRISNECFTAATLVLFLLTADVVEGEKQVMSFRQTSWKSQLHFLIEVWRPERQRGQDRE